MSSPGFARRWLVGDCFIIPAAAGEVSLDPGFRNQKPWSEQAKWALIDRGYELADLELRQFEPAARAAEG